MYWEIAMAGRPWMTASRAAAAVTALRGRIAAWRDARDAARAAAAADRAAATGAAITWRDAAHLKSWLAAHRATAAQLRQHPLQHVELALLDELRRISKPILVGIGVPLIDDLFVHLSVAVIVDVIAALFGAWLDVIVTVIAVQVRWDAIAVRIDGGIGIPRVVVVDRVVVDLATPHSPLYNRRV